MPHHWRERILRLLDHLERNLASYGQLKRTALIGAIAAVIFVLGWMYCRIVATSRALTADKAELNQNATTVSPFPLPFGSLHVIRLFLSPAEWRHC